MAAKYILTNETIEYDGKTLHRIKALSDFGNVKKGDLGGYVESDFNLSNMSDCWIYDHAKVYGYCRVTGHARIYGFTTALKEDKLIMDWDVYGTPPKEPINTKLVRFIRMLWFWFCN